ncbi:MAG: Arc family DNA-binding protein [Planctomycetales bacterium]|nr:Arc family DNA-binding protein [Planctomycetales bacterium]
MARRDSFLLRIDPGVLDAVRQWAEDDLRSVNGQLEWILRGALKAAGRTPKPKPRAAPTKETANGDGASTDVESESEE